VIKRLVLLTAYTVIKRTVKFIVLLCFIDCIAIFLYHVLVNKDEYNVNVDLYSA